MKTPLPRIHILTIDNDEGLFSSAYLTRAGADAALHAYVADNWPASLGDIPSEPSEAAPTY